MGWEPLYWLLGGLLLFALVLYVLSPIIVLATMRHRMPPNVNRIHGDDYPLPEEARAYVAVADRDLAEAGFQYLGTLHMPNATPHVEALLWLYVNRPAYDVALLTVLVVRSPAMNKVIRHAEFIRSFDDEVHVQTNSSEEMGAFDPVPNEFVFRLPHVQDIRRLYRLHQLLAEEHRQRGWPYLPLDRDFAGDIESFAVEAIDRSFRNQIGTGLLKRTADGYRPTVRGAFVMTWRQLWPFKGIRRRRDERQEQALLAKLLSE